ncbi:glycosyltransferase family 4 protein [Tsuneonella amylolytica]|uniref:glycosyltransferase family 4 protein n=1 Tax=Tsuneonella amylolytica TaxID=2338327 RepID=UPI000EA91396|nr:glycosyltransferase family 4 protein [Tsuneonella amylolytica]
MTSNVFPTASHAAPLVPFRSPRAQRRVAVVGNYVPRKCGIATFTADLVEQLARYRPEVSVDVWALDDAGDDLGYEGVAGTIDRADPADYARAAKAINDAGVDAVWLQHEYGIFGGADGEMAMEFVDRLAAPLIVTCHTVLTEPSVNQRRILEHLVQRASRIMVMSHRSRDLLIERYHAPSEAVEVIEHGAPDRPFGRQDEFKARMGLDGRTVLTTFGLLGPGKGLEHAIEALPAILADHPGVLYRIVGATHPNLVAQHGESYREGLQARAEALGVADAIEWDDRFVETDELLDQLEACDIYITPYPGLQQSTSGTLSYAVALGKAVVSTPYVHARELLAGGVGYIIDPNSSGAIAQAVNSLLDHPRELAAMQRRAYAKGRETIWPRFAAAAAALVESAVSEAPREPARRTAPSLAALFAMSDATGMLQHSKGVVPDRNHGYCLDDNARALMLMNLAAGVTPEERAVRTTAYAAFIQHAWNPDRGLFRNFMNYDRSWCEDEGSEDSNGRALWALGRTAQDTTDDGIRDWAMELYDQALLARPEMESPRAVAFAMLGASAMVAAKPGHDISLALLARGTDLLERLLGGARRPDWSWFETVLGYDNPRLPQALIEAGRTLGREDYLATGLETLDWIADRQTATSGHFRPIGSESFGIEFEALPFDQQPLEAQAAIDAAASAYAATGDAHWAVHARAAWKWFFGGNDRGVVLADLATGRCRDGINPRGLNRNTGAESILAFHLSHYSMLALGHTATDDDSPGGKIEHDRQEAGRPLAHP